MNLDTSRPTGGVFAVFSLVQWVFDDLLEGLNREGFRGEAYRSLCVDVPTFPAERLVGAWMPLLHAARLVAAGWGPRLTAPPSSVMSALPTELTGRDVLTFTVDEAFERSIVDCAGFWKFAEAKSEWFGAEWRKDGVRDLLMGREWLSGGSLLQFTSTLLDIVEETRFFISRDALGQYSWDGSVYKKGDWIYYDTLEEVPADPRTEKFLADSITRIGQDCPDGFVVDVATLGDGRRVVLELNPVWACGMYSCDLGMVVKSIMSSFSDNPSPLWVPDLYYQKAIPLPRRPQSPTRPS